MNNPKFVGYWVVDGWKQPLPFYSWYCDICKKQVVNYYTTHYETLKCPICIKKMIDETRSKNIEVLM